MAERNRILRALAWFFFVIYRWIMHCLPRALIRADSLISSISRDMLSTNKTHEKKNFDDWYIIIQDSEQLTNLWRYKVSRELNIFRRKCKIVLYIISNNSSFKWTCLMAGALYCTVSPTILAGNELWFKLSLGLGFSLWLIKRLSYFLALNLTFEDSYHICSIPPND